MVTYLVLKKKLSVPIKDYVIFTLFMFSSVGYSFCYLIIHIHNNLVVEYCRQLCDGHGIDSVVGLIDHPYS